MGASVLSRLGGVEPAEVLEIPVEEVVQHARLTEKGRKAFEELKSDFDPCEVRAAFVERPRGRNPC